MKTELITPPEWRAPIAGYLAWLALIRPESTCKLRSYHLRRFAVVTGISPRLVTLDDLIAFVGSNGWGRSTKHTVQGSMKSFFLWAHKVAKIVDENPAELLPSTRPQAGEPRPAADSAVHDAIAQADERTALMLRLAAYVGLRCCEICRVHTGDIYIEPGGYSLRVLGKGSKPRRLPLPQALARDLLQLEPGWVFSGQVDGHLSAPYVSKIVSRALPAGITAHMLRHRFASVTFITSGNNLRAVQNLLGHASVATTQIYTAVSSGALRDAVEAAYSA